MKKNQREKQTVCATRRCMLGMRPGHAQHAEDDKNVIYKKNSKKTKICTVFYVYDYIQR